MITIILKNKGINMIALNKFFENDFIQPPIGNTPLTTSKQLILVNSNTKIKKIK